MPTPGCTVVSFAPSNHREPPGEKPALLGVFVVPVISPRRAACPSNEEKRMYSRSLADTVALNCENPAGTPKRAAEAVSAATGTSPSPTNRLVGSPNADHTGHGSLMVNCWATPSLVNVT